MEDNLVLEQLRKIRAELDATRERDHEVMARLGGIETGLTRIARDEAGNYRVRVTSMQETLDYLRQTRAIHAHLLAGRYYPINRARQEHHR